MAWTVGTASTFQHNTDPSFAHTVVTGDDRVLIVGVGFRNGAVSGARYNGVAMTEIGTGAGAPSPANGNPAIRWWYLVNPPVGTFNVTFDTATAQRYAGGAVVAYGINQTTSIRTPVINNDQSNSATSSTINPESVIDDLILDFLRIGSSVSSSAIAADAGQTQLFATFANAGHVCLSHKNGAATQTSMGWTWTGTNRVAHASVALIPAGVALDPPNGTVTIGTTETKSTSLKFEFNDTSTNATGYEYRIDGGTPVDIGAPSPKEYKIWNLTPSTVYDSPGLEVRAYNLDGSGDWSTAASFTTLAAVAPVFARLNKTFHLQSQTSGEITASGSSTLRMSASLEYGGTVTLYRDRKPITRVCTVSNPFVVVTANTTTADSNITLWDNGSATAVTITIPAGQIGTFRDDVNEHTFDGTTEGWWIATHGAGGSYTARSFGHVITPASNEVIVSWIGPHSSGETNFVSSASRYLLPIGARNIDAIETQAELRALFPGTIKDLKVAGSNGQVDPFTGIATVGFRKNSADTALIALWDSANETGGTDRIMIVNNLTDTAPIALGDEITLFARPHAGATGSTRDVTWFGTLESDNSGGAGEFLLAIGNTTGFSSITTGTYYTAVAGEGIYTLTESNTQAPVSFAARLFRFTARVSDTNNGACTITLRRNGVDTDFQLSFVTSDTGVTKEFPIDEFEDFAEGDLIDYKVEHTSGAQLRIQYIALSGAAILGGVVTRTLNVDALLQKQRNVTSEIGAQLSKNVLTTADIGAVLTKGYVLVTDIDSYLQKIRLITTDIDAVLGGLFAIITQIDAYLQRNVSVLTEIDALLIAPQTVQTNVDSILQLRREVIITSEALLSKTRSVVITVDAVLLEAGVTAVTVDIDALLNKLRSVAVTSDALLRRVFQTQITIDSILQTRRVLTLLVNVVLQKTQLITLAADSVLFDADALGFQGTVGGFNLSQSNVNFGVSRSFILDNPRGFRRLS